MCACADIREFGAISGDSSDATATVNSAAILKAILAANASSTDRTVLVPAGLNFTVFNTSISNVNDVTLQIDGVLVVSNNISNTNWVNNNGGACGGRVGARATRAK